jgi:hypothetical protein
MILLLLVSACEQEEIAVSGGAGDDSVYGRADLRAVVQAFSGNGRTPAGYRAMAEQIAALRPRFDTDTAAEAERSLVLLALGPLDAAFEEPAPAQLERLALTVWPTVLREEPRAGETPDGYAERLCGEPLAPQCKYVVPEHRPLILGALVWQRLLERARLVVSTCRACEGNPEYAQVVSRIKRREVEIQERASQVAKHANPRRWPVGGAHAGPWTAMPLAEIRADGTVVMAGRDLPARAWRETLAAARNGAGTLGVVIEPASPVARLRALAEEAAGAGFRELALQVRTPEYPYALRAYRMTLSRRSRKRGLVRDIDSVQVLVQALEVAAATGKAPLPL